MTTRRCAMLALGGTLAAMLASPVFAADNLELIPDLALFGLLDGFGIEDEGGRLGKLWIMMIGFVVLIFPLNKLIFQPIFRALDARTERIEGARAQSARLQRDADAVLERYEAAIREARGESEASRQAQLVSARDEQVLLTAEARGEAERQLERARSELTTSREQARSTLRAAAEDLATAAAEQILGRSMS